MTAAALMSVFMVSPLVLVGRILARLYALWCSDAKLIHHSALIPRSKMMIQKALWETEKRGNTTSRRTAPGRSLAVPPGFDGFDFIHDPVHPRDDRSVGSGARQVDPRGLHEVIRIVGPARPEELQVLFPRAGLVLQHRIGEKRARRDRGRVLEDVERVIEVRDVGPLDGVR